MKSQSLIATLALLAALCPLALASTETKPEPQSAPTAITGYKDNAQNKITDINDFSSPREATLAKNIGKKISVKGKLTRFQNGRVGITVSGTTYTQISIDPLPCPIHGELPFKFVVKASRPTTKKPKYHHRSPRQWIVSDARRRKLDHLIEQCTFGDSIVLTGQLCHLTSTIIGNVQKNIGYPKIPDSHFFFSVDDVTLVRN